MAAALFDNRTSDSIKNSEKEYRRLQKGKSERILVKNAKKLHGMVSVSPAKNAMLPILAAVILSKKPVHLINIPDLRDMHALISILEDMGVKVSKKGRTTTFDASNLKTNIANSDLVSSMRASNLILGPLLGRLGAGRVALPGGCPIGGRPMDIHLKGFEQLGATITHGCDFIQGISTGLSGADIKLSFPSVGATENIMMAAVLAKGKTTISNAALEPEIDDLANFLNKMGAKISGVGTTCLTIQGVSELHEVTYQAIGDRIEAATYIIAALMTNSKVRVENINPQHIQPVIKILKDMNASIRVEKNMVEVRKSKLKAAKVVTLPHPGFPTDVQAQLMALMTQAEGKSEITETIFENRFMHVEHLKRMGANININGKTATIVGPTPLEGRPVTCTDLRASAAMVLSALVAKGVTEIRDVFHMDRGYDHLERKMGLLGASISRIS
ncbi:MAG: UDP-N-acetylglucosamine 1-carboxyvinyltransferase [Bdellovibrionales bacterium]|nr:UDP-N-acetylglucosamine 1-carboxyvinyltransferase [Bdellovibrionales bacterium]MBT3525304.1 UDP-N-acetylglucosamine 1-carboxyvinyltransferase [Bdellovibrionales bacterium]MBT7766869.1 UDP-N-acetylglucosamine 1-carboxyvinyltransferase [Bdellovibrionales bacterium]